MHANGWVDYGSPKKFRNYSDEELAYVYKNCHVAQYKCINVYNGKMLNCSWILLGRAIDIFPKDNPPPEKYAENQILDILDESIPLERKREIAASWGTKPNWQCQYCNGFNVKKSKRIPGGEQI